jgi:TolQ protein
MRVISQRDGRSGLRIALVFLVMACSGVALAPAAHAQRPEPGGISASSGDEEAAEPAVAGAEVDSLTGEGAVEGEDQLQQDLSVYSMFMDAGTVAKSVMILLMLASVWNIAILVEKWFLLKRVNRQADRFLTQFRAAKTLEDLSRGSQARPDGPMARMFAAGMQEYHLTADHGVGVVSQLRERIRERIAYAMNIVQSHETRSLGNSMSVLATIGSTAPFIGLFGTVWGIMTSFIGIAQTQTTNLAVVAPGIAEALLATAIGLAAAIPAVMIYNKFSRDIGTFSGRLEDFSSEFAVVLSRELDHREIA